MTTKDFYLLILSTFAYKGSQNESPRLVTMDIDVQETSLHYPFPHYTEPYHYRLSNSSKSPNSCCITPYQEAF